MIRATTAVVGGHSGVVVADEAVPLAQAPSGGAACPLRQSARAVARAQFRMQQCRIAWGGSAGGGGAAAGLTGRTTLRPDVAGSSVK